MKRIVLGLLLSAVWGVAQAGALVINNATAISFKGYDGQPKTVTGAESKGTLGTLSATSAGIFSATYLGQESGYTNSFSFGTGKSSLLEGDMLGTTISESVSAAGIVSFSFSDYFLKTVKENKKTITYTYTDIFTNGETAGDVFGYVIMQGQKNSYGDFDYILGFNDSWSGDADYDDFVVGVKFTSAEAPVPEPRSYAMLLAGLGLLGLSIRRRREGAFD
ncbi:MAG: PEP-CTERM sorting domain-containing protein [Sideroxyarcus sp.]